jgi:hypothetical protein
MMRITPENITMYPTENTTLTTNSCEHKVAYFLLFSSDPELQSHALAPRERHPTAHKHLSATARYKSR